MGVKEMKPKNPYTPYGRWVMGQLIKRNMTVKELAERIGTTSDRISKITRGVNKDERIRTLIDGELGRRKAGQAS